MLRPLRRERRGWGSELPPRRGMSGWRAQKPLRFSLGSCGRSGHGRAALSLSLSPRPRRSLCSEEESAAVPCPTTCPLYPAGVCGRSGRSQPADGFPEAADGFPEPAGLWFPRPRSPVLAAPHRPGRAPPGLAFKTTKLVPYLSS